MLLNSLHCPRVISGHNTISEQSHSKWSVGVSETRSVGLIAVIAGLFGAAGIALGAIAAHRVPDPGLVTSANYLVMHAAGALAVAFGASQQERLRLWLLGAALLLAGSGLFASDMASRAFLGGKLFPFAAPMGGSTMILGWLVIGVAGILSLRPR